MMNTHSIDRRSSLALLSLPLVGAGLSGCAIHAGSADQGSKAKVTQVTKLAAGTHRLEMAEPSGANNSPMAVFIHQPANWTTSDGIMVVLHGTNRDADRYLANWIEHASSASMLLVTPEFNQVKFPGRNFYNFGNVVDEKMQARERSQWSFDILDRVFEHVRQATGAQRNSYGLYGHSAGAQFVHRFMLLASASKAEVIVSANAGSYTMPVYDVEFPWGLKNTQVTTDDLRRAFARQVVIQLGDQDIDPNHSSLPRDPQAMQQGLFRLARGQKFFETAQKTAASLNTPFSWRLETVPGVAHSDKGMAPAAIQSIKKAMKA
jgi:poly(3-hydroxybutyrate) depolymerase